ncbi:hypothetical protein JCM33374_g2130 [Metschnikowia sp. JCM 33374]|nr:hypothetical protein JCM33374_g2130 [Metschnikowia sp. JCM 33374]
MGNSPSKTKGGVPLTRTDTGSSAKSSRSIRSRISLSNTNDSPKQPHRRSSSTSLPNSSTVSKDSEPSPGLTHASMRTPEPKSPILMRRNTNDSDVTTRLSVSGASNGDDLTSPLSRSSTNHSNRSSSFLTPQHTGMTAGSSQDDKSDAISVSSRKSGRSLSSFSNSRRGSSKTSRELLAEQPELTNNIDLEGYIQRLLDAGYSGKRTKFVCLKNHEIQQICAKAREIFLSQPSLLELSPPVKVVGDVHGQYSDLIRIFTKCGFPPQTNYLFLGDYVDRGKQSLETILLLLCYKIKYPENFFLLRGNHECANVTRVYGFYDECKRRCNIKTWKSFIDTFNTLPIAAIVAGKIFCVHGGLSPVLNTMDEIRNIARPTDVPDFGLLNDLLWSDPADTINEWEDNERGVSYVFSKVAINKFLQKFGFDLVCRAHMVVEDGYEFFNDRTLVTVFSAPNYCGEFDNWGAVMSVSEELLCSFELLDPLDSVALKQAMKKGKQERKSAQAQLQKSD